MKSSILPFSLDKEQTHRERSNSIGYSWRFLAAALVTLGVYVFRLFLRRRAMGNAGAAPCPAPAVTAGGRKETADRVAQNAGSKGP